MKSFREEFRELQGLYHNLVLLSLMLSLVPWQIMSLSLCLCQMAKWQPPWGKYLELEVAEIGFLFFIIGLLLSSTGVFFSKSTKISVLSKAASMIRDEDDVEGGN